MADQCVGAGNLRCCCWRLIQAGLVMCGGVPSPAQRFSGRKPRDASLARMEDRSTSDINKKCNTRSLFSSTTSIDCRPPHTTSLRYAKPIYRSIHSRVKHTRYKQIFGISKHIPLGPPIKDCHAYIKSKHAFTHSNIRTFFQVVLG